MYVRAGMVLDCAAGLSGAEIAERHRTSQQTAGKWRGRFARECLAGLSDAPRGGQPRRHGDERVQEVPDATLNRRPKKATHWSVRSLSEELGLPRDSVHRVWRAFGLKPHLSCSFKLSADPHKVRDVVGLYLDPPDRAPVLCVDEKSQIQALDCTQPMLPMRPGPGGATHPRLQVLRHDHPVRRPGRCGRHGHRELHTVIGSCMRWHRAR